MQLVTKAHTPTVSTSGLVSSKALLIPGQAQKTNC